MTGTRRRRGCCPQTDVAADTPGRAKTAMKLRRKPASRARAVMAKPSLIRGEPGCLCGQVSVGVVRVQRLRAACCHHRSAGIVRAR